MWATVGLTEPPGRPHSPADMTRHCVSILCTLPLLALAATGCNLDLEDLLDDGMDTEAAVDDDTGGDDTGADDAADGADDDGADTTGGGAPGDALPPELVGAWATAIDAGAMIVEFFDDGSYAQLLYQEYDDGGCATISQEVYAGTIALDGATMVLSPLEGYQGLDQCGTVSEGAAVPDAIALSWSLAADDQGDALVLDDGDGEVVLRRTEGL